MGLSDERVRPPGREIFTLHRTQIPSLRDPWCNDQASDPSDTVPRLRAGSGLAVKRCPTSLPVINRPTPRHHITRSGRPHTTTHQVFSIFAGMKWELSVPSYIFRFGIPIGAVLYCRRCTVSPPGAPLDDFVEFLLCCPYHMRVESHDYGRGYAGWMFCLLTQRAGGNRSPQRPRGNEPSARS